MWTPVAQGSMRQALVPRDASAFLAVIIAAPASTLRPAKSVVMATICMRGSASLVVLQGLMQKVWNSIRAANVLHAPVAA